MTPFIDHELLCPVPKGKLNFWVFQTFMSMVLLFYMFLTQIMLLSFLFQLNNPPQHRDRNLARAEIFKNISEDPYDQLRGYAQHLSLSTLPQFRTVMPITLLRQGMGEEPCR